MHNMLITGAHYDDVEPGAGRRPSDGLFIFSKTAPELYNHIPGQTKPCPGAYFMADVNDTMKKIYVWRAISDVDHVPGGVTVVCKDQKNSHFCGYKLRINQKDGLWTVCGTYPLDRKSVV